jgi:hypothetical protein
MNGARLRLGVDERWFVRDPQICGGPGCCYLALIAGGNDPITLEVHPNLTVLGYTAALSLLTGVLSGLAPAARATRVEVAPNLKDVAPTVTHGSGGLANLLVAGQMAICLVLLYGTGRVCEDP